MSKNQDLKDFNVKILDTIINSIKSTSLGDLAQSKQFQLETSKLAASFGDVLNYENAKLYKAKIDEITALKHPECVSTPLEYNIEDANKMIDCIEKIKRIAIEAADFIYPPEEEFQQTTEFNSINEDLVIISHYNEL